MSEIDNFTLFTLFLGLGLGWTWHHFYVRRMVLKLKDMHEEFMMMNVVDHIEENIFIAYPERDEKTGRYRIFEVGTHKFLAQGNNAQEIHEAFFDRYPDKKFVLIHSDEQLAEEMGHSTQELDR